MAAVLYWTTKFENDAGSDPCDWNPDDVCRGVSALFVAGFYSDALSKVPQGSSVAAPAFPMLSGPHAMLAHPLH